MGEPIGLSIGATRFAGVQLGRAAMTRPSIAEFVERVGDPVGVLAADGSMRRGELVVADELRDLLYAVTGGRPPAKPAVVAYPAHWRKAQVDALRWALMRVPEWSREPIMLIPDTAAAITALQSDPGVPARGVIVLCDFGGTGTNVSLLDASRGYAPIGPTVRHTDFSGDLIDQALLAHVVTDVSPAPAVDATGTSALGPLHRLRAECRGAKERLSSSAVTALSADLPGFSGDVRLTRTELDELIHRPLSEFVRVVDDTVTRAGVRPAEVVAVASVGGGARIPAITTALSERFRVPVVTTPHPELASATGGAHRAAWGPADDRSTAIAPALVAAAAPAFADADAQSSTFRALAWSEAHDVPPIAKPVEASVEAPESPSGARPRLEFEDVGQPAPVAKPWYRRGSTLAGAATAAVLLLAASAVVAFGSDSPTMSTTATPGPSTTSAAPAPAPVDNPAQAQDPPRTVYVSPAPPEQAQAPITQYVAPAPQPAAAPPPAAAPSPEAPPPAPSSEAPPPPPTETQTVTATATPPPPSAQSPPPQDPPSTQPQSPPSNTQPPVTLTIPPIPQIPGFPQPHNR